MSESKRMKLVAVVTRGDGDKKRSFWTTIGVAFPNRDGSFNLRFDYLPTHPDTTIQMRPFEPGSND